MKRHAGGGWLPLTCAEAEEDTRRWRSAKEDEDEDETKEEEDANTLASLCSSNRSSRMRVRRV